MINTMNLVWGFDFRKLPRKAEPVDVWAYEKVSVSPAPNFTYPLVRRLADRPQGILTSPKPYEFSITPRSEQHARIIRGQFADTIPMFLPYERRLDDEDKKLLLKLRQEDGIFE
jgi:hypothetical protein